MKLKLWLSTCTFVVLLTLEAWTLAIQPRVVKAPAASPALRKWRQQQALKRHMLQTRPIASPRRVGTLLATTKANIARAKQLKPLAKQQQKNNFNRNGLNKIKSKKPNTKRFAYRNKNQGPLRAFNYKLQRPITTRAQARNMLGEPIGNGLFLANENLQRGTVKENIYPRNAYQQVENYVDSVLQETIRRPSPIQRAGMGRAAVAAPLPVPAPAPVPASPPLPPPPPPPPPPSSPPPPPPPVPPPPPPPVPPPPPPPPPPAPALPPPVPRPQPAPAPPPAPAAPAPAPAPVAPPPALPATNDAASQEPAGEMVEMPGPNGKPMKYYVQSYTSELVPDGKGGYKEIMPNARNAGLEVVAPAPAANTPVKSQKNVQHRAKINDCTIAMGNRSEEQSQPSKRVYSLGGHVFADLGCYSDCWKRAIPTLEGNHELLMDDNYKNRGDALQKCAEAALDRGYKYFAVQNGGQCFAGMNGNKRYNMYGHSDRCRDDGLGGPYANEVYMFEESPTPKRVPSSYKNPTETQKHLAGKCRNNDCDGENYDASLLKEEQDLSEEEDEIESSDDTKKHKNKLKAIGAAIQKLLKKHDNDNALAKGDIEDETKSSKEDTPTAKATAKIKPKNTTIDELTSALVKAANSKHKMKNTTMEYGSTEKEGKSLLSDHEADGISGEENSKSTAKGDKILEDLGLKKKKKDLPLASAVARGEKPPCICPDKVCSSKLDLAFAIDASAGAEQGGKEKMAEVTEFARRVAAAFKVAPADSHLGLITFSTDAQVMLNFKRFSDPESFAEAKDSVRVKPHSGKFTGQALKLAKEGLFGAVHRPDALDVLVLLTDGPSSDNVMAPARALRDMGVKLITVGIGDHINKRQLANIASDPDDANMFLTEFDNLQPLIPKIQKAACVGGTLKEPTAPCRCEEKSPNPDPEAEVETAAFLSLLSMNDLETEAEGGKAERHDDIPTASPVDNYKLMLKRGGILSPLGRRLTTQSARDTIESSALPFNNPHPVDFDADVQGHSGYMKNTMNHEESVKGSRFEHSFESGDNWRETQERDRSNKGAFSTPKVTSNLDSTQTDEPEYTSESQIQNNRQSGSFNSNAQTNEKTEEKENQKPQQNKDNYSSAESKNDKQNENNGRPKFGNTERPKFGNNERPQFENNEKSQSENNEKPINENGTSGEKGQEGSKTNSYQNESNGEKGQEGSKTNSYQNESNGEKGQEGSKTNSYQNESNGDRGREGSQASSYQNDKNGESGKQGSQMNGNQSNNEETKPTQSGFQDLGQFQNIGDHQEANHAASNGKQGDVNEQKMQPSGNKDVNNEGTSQERKPDLSKEELNTQGKQGKNFNGDREENRPSGQQGVMTDKGLYVSEGNNGGDNRPQQGKEANVDDKPDGSRFNQENGVGSQQNGKYNENAKNGHDMNNEPKKGQEQNFQQQFDTNEGQANGGKEETNSNGKQGKENKNVDKFVPNDVPSNGNGNEMKNTLNNNEAVGQGTYKADDKVNDPKLKAELYNQYVYKQELQNNGQGNNSGNNQESGDNNDNRDQMHRYEGTLYKDKKEETRDKNGNVIEKQKYRGTLFLYDKDDKDNENQKGSTEKQESNSEKQGEKQNENRMAEIKGNNQGEQRFDTPNEGKNNNNAEERKQGYGKEEEKGKNQEERNERMNQNNQGNERKDNGKQVNEKNDENKENSNSKTQENQQTDKNFGPSQSEGGKGNDRPTQNNNMLGGKDNGKEDQQETQQNSKNQKQEYKESKENEQEEGKKGKEGNKFNNVKNEDGGQQKNENSEMVKSQQDQDVTSFGHGHGHGHEHEGHGEHGHGHEHEHEHEGHGEHGHEPGHGKMKPKFAEGTDQPQKETQNEGQKQTFNENSNGEKDSKEQNTQTIGREGYHFDTGETHGAKGYENKEDSREPVRGMKDSEKDENEETMNNKQNSGNGSEEKQNKMTNGKDERQKERKENFKGSNENSKKEDKEERQENFNGKNGKEERGQAEEKNERFNGKERNNEEEKQNKNEWKNGENKGKDENDRKKLQGDKEEENKSSSNSEKSNDDNKNGRFSEEGKGNGKEERQNGKDDRESDKNERQKDDREKFTGSNSEGGRKNENEKQRFEEKEGGRNENKNDENKQNSLQNTEKSEENGNAVKNKEFNDKQKEYKASNEGNDTSKKEEESEENQEKIKKIEEKMERSKESFKNENTGQASIADLQANGYETINDIIKYPRKNLLNSNIGNIGNKMEKGRENSFSQGFNDGIGQISGHASNGPAINNRPVVNNGPTNIQMMGINSGPVSSNGLMSGARKEEINGLSHYDGDIEMSVIKQFHSEGKANLDHMEEIRKHRKIEDDDSDEMKERKFKPTGKSENGKEISENGKDNAKGERLGPKGPSAWHKPPQPQNTIHHEGASRDEEYKQKDEKVKNAKGPSVMHLNLSPNAIKGQDSKVPQNNNNNINNNNNGNNKINGNKQIEIIQSPGNGNKQQQQPMDPEQQMLMRESEKAGQEFENEMNSNTMDSEMQDMNSEMGDGTQNGGMRQHIAKKEDTTTRAYPTAPVRDLVGEKIGVENQDEKQMIQTRNKIQKAASKRAPVRLDGVAKSKSQEKNKGILLKDPFLESSHFWPLDNRKSILSIDIQTGHNAILMNGSTIASDPKTKLVYATTEYPGSYIILGDFNGTCFSDPGKCILGGLTVSFWVNLDKEKVRNDQDAYIISGGGQSKESRGFGFLFFHGQYVFVLSTSNKQWKMTIPEAKVPTGKWVNIAFVWEKSRQLTYYLDGEKVMSVKGNSASRPSDKYPLITIGKPNNAESREYMYPLKMHSVAMWDRPLKCDQVKGIFDELKEIRQKRRLIKKFLIAKPNIAKQFMQIL